MSLRLIAAAGGAVFAAFAVSSMAADAARGEGLYQNHCTGCHTSQAHIRTVRKADSPQALYDWIQRWQSNQSLSWSNADINDVAAYLDERYYKFKPTVKQ